MKFSADRPLIRARLRRLLLALGLSAVTTTAAAAAVSRSSLAFNRTDSLPIGFYATRSINHPPLRGELVALAMPASVRLMAVERRYLERSDELLFKAVVAVPGDHVCLTGALYTVNGAVIGNVLSVDLNGRPLPAYQFCGSVGAGEYWVGTQASRSFDSRYFGPVPAVAFLARLEPQWTF